MPKYKPYQVPLSIHKKFEEEAMRRRKKTGKNITWSMIVREVLENFFKGDKK